MRCWINEGGVLVVAPDTGDETRALTKWFTEYRAGINVLWVGTVKEGVPGVFYEPIVAAIRKADEI